MASIERTFKEIPKRSQQEKKKRKQTPNHIIIEGKEEISGINYE